MQKNESASSRVVALIENDATLRLLDGLRDAGLTITAAREVSAAFQQLESQPAALFVCEHPVCGLPGSSILDQVARLHPGTKRMLLVAPTPATAQPDRAHGAQLTVQLPASGETVCSAALDLLSGKTKTQPLSLGSVLVVSHEESAAMALVLAAKQAGFGCQTQSSAGAAIAALRERISDWLILDENLPHASMVLAFYYRLRAAPRLVLVRERKDRKDPAPTPRIVWKPIAPTAVAAALGAAPLRSARVPTPLHVVVKPARGGEHRLPLRNLSRTGAFLGWPRAPAVGTELHLTILVEPLPFDLTGRIVRTVTEAQAWDEGLEAGAGVVLTNRDPALQGRIDELLLLLGSPELAAAGATSVTARHLAQLNAERQNKAAQHAEAARQELGRSSGADLEKAYREANLAVSHDDTNDDFLELRRIVTGLVNARRADAAFMRGAALEANKDLPAALSAYDEAVLLNPTKQFILAACRARRSLHAELGKVRELALLCLQIHGEDEAVRSLIRQH